MFYTIYPPEVFLDEEGDAFSVLDMSVQGRRLLAAQGPDGALTLERLLSTDPRDYLNPSFQPGTPVPPATDGV